MPDAVQNFGFYTAHRVGLLVLSLILAAAIFELVRRGHLKEKYALLWLLAAGCSLLVGVFPTIIVRLSQIFGFQYLTLVYAISFLFLLFLVLAFSVVISRLSERVRDLAQETALLEERLRNVEKK
jgi:hypothetical protein